MVAGNPSVGTQLALLLCFLGSRKQEAGGETVLISVSRPPFLAALGRISVGFLLGFGGVSWSLSMTSSQGTFLVFP